ncbi:MAG: hypothetical protein H6704_27800 [Myxococcales bacterium]|nr:hypothetical protein [Myxococcales bacterium]
MRRLVCLWAVAALACTDDTAERAARNGAARERTLVDTLVVRVQGGTTVGSERVAEGRFRVFVRAQSLDLRVEIEDGGCAPRAVELVVTHLPAEGLQTTARSFLAGLSPVVSAARRAAGGAVLFTGDAHDPDWTPLGPESAFAPRTDGRTRTWTAVLDRGARSARVVDTAIADLDLPAPPGACARLGAERLGGIGQAPIVLRHRLRVPLEGADVVFAVWGNAAGRAGTRAKILEAVAASDARFAVVSGDLTADGSAAQLKATVEQIDDALTIPWFATLGERDLQGGAVDDYVRLLGASTFAFDAGPVRVAVLDSAGGGLSADAHTSLRRWVGDQTLWWSADAPPPTRVVVTHTPPFDPAGARGAGFRSRLEATRLVALLQRSDVPYLLTSHLPIWQTDVLAGVRVVHAGGAGAPLEESDETHFWVRVTARAGCVEVGEVGAAEGEACGAGCGGGLACVEGTCGPCVEVERRDPAR